MIGKPKTFYIKYPTEHF